MEKQNFRYENVNYEEVKRAKQKMIGESVLRNSRDQIDIEIERIIDPQNNQTYLEAEGFMQEYEEGTTPEQAHQEGRNNGVAQNPDGSVDLRYDGSSHRISRDGIPAE